MEVHVPVETPAMESNRVAIHAFYFPRGLFLLLLALRGQFPGFLALLTLWLSLPWQKN